MSWRIEVATTAEKHLKRFPKRDRDRISHILDSFETDPFVGDIVKIGGFEARFRNRASQFTH